MKHFSILLGLLLLVSMTAGAAVTQYPYSYGWNGATNVLGDGNWSTTREHTQANFWGFSATGGNFGPECATLAGFSSMNNSSRLQLALNLSGRTLQGGEVLTFWMMRTGTASGPADLFVQFSTNGGSSWNNFSQGNLGSLYGTNALPVANQYKFFVIDFTGAGLSNNANAMVAITLTSRSGSLNFDNVRVDDVSIEGGALPITLAAFTGAVVNENDVLLEWSTISEINNYGFFVQRRVEGDLNFTDIPGAFIPGAGTTLEPQYYSWTHTGVAPGSYEYCLRQQDLDGTNHYTFGVPVIVNSPLSVKDGEAVPAVFALNQNYPNPFNPSTKISFSLAEPGFTTVKIYNMIGQEVATLFSGMAEAARMYVVDFDASSLGNGIYFYRLQSGSQVEVRKMTLLK